MEKSRTSRPNMKGHAHRSDRPRKKSKPRPIPKVYSRKLTTKQESVAKPSELMPPKRSTIGEKFQNYGSNLPSNYGGVPFGRAWFENYPYMPDPTAPHLKYGLFNKRISRYNAASAYPPKPEVNHILRNKDNVMCLRKKTMKNVPAPEESPKVEVIPPTIISINGYFSRTLVKSEILHVDIKPKGISNRSRGVLPKQDSLQKTGKIL